MSNEGRNSLLIALHSLLLFPHQQHRLVGHGLEPLFPTRTRKLGLLRRGQGENVPRQACTRVRGRLRPRQPRRERLVDGPAREPLKLQARPGEPRHMVLVYSQRNFTVQKWNIPQLEFEDVIATMDAVDIVSPLARSTSRIGLNARRARNVLREALGHYRIPSYDSVAVDRDYEMFFGVFHFIHELPQLLRLKGWRERCKTAVCFIVELWNPWLDEQAQYVSLLREFDHVFLLNRATVPTLSDRISRPIRFLPTGVDTERFSPWPRLPPRHIDFLSYGRRLPAVHAWLREFARREGRTYLFDTVGAVPIANYREHRELLAHMLQRSRYSMTYRINDSHERLARTGGEEGLPQRYFENAAAGTVMIGSAPRCEEYETCFDWPDATISLPADLRQMGEFFADLDADVERVSRIRMNGVANSLRRHDWAYRWATILDAAGLAHTSAMQARIARLHALAEEASGSSIVDQRVPTDALVPTTGELARR